MRARTADACQCGDALSARKGRLSELVGRVRSGGLGASSKVSCSAAPHVPVASPPADEYAAPPFDLTATGATAEQRTVWCAGAHGGQLVREGVSGGCGFRIVECESALQKR